MSTTLKESSKKRKKPTAKLDPARPFDPGILRRAAIIAREYSIVLEPNDELGYIARSVEFPNVMADGRTVEACVASEREALTTVVATLLEVGEEPPAPTSRTIRDKQIRISLTAGEKTRLEAAARRDGWHAVSDFARSLLLERGL